MFKVGSRCGICNTTIESSYASGLTCYGTKPWRLRLKAASDSACVCWKHKCNEVSHEGHDNTWRRPGWYCQGSGDLPWTREVSPVYQESSSEVFAKGSVLKAREGNNRVRLLTDCLVLMWRSADDSGNIRTLDFSSCSKVTTSWSCHRANHHVNSARDKRITTIIISTNICFPQSTGCALSLPSVTPNCTAHHQDVKAEWKDASDHERILQPVLQALGRQEQGVMSVTETVYITPDLHFIRVILCKVYHLACITMAMFSTPSQCCPCITITWSQLMWTRSLLQLDFLESGLVYIIADQLWLHRALRLVPFTRKTTR